MMPHHNPRPGLSPGRVVYVAVLVPAVLLLAVVAGSLRDVLSGPEAPDEAPRAPRRVATAAHSPAPSGPCDGGQSQGAALPPSCLSPAFPLRG